MKSMRPFFAIILIALCLSVLRILRPIVRHIKDPLVDMGCSNEVLMSVRNEKGNYAASLIERDCGATTNFVRSIYIAPVSNVSDIDDPVTVANGIGISSIHWKDDHTLEVIYDPHMTKFFLQKAAQGKFSILYSTTAPNHVYRRTNVH